MNELTSYITITNRHRNGIDQKISLIIWLQDGENSDGK